MQLFLDFNLFPIGKHTHGSHNYFVISMIRKLFLKMLRKLKVGPKKQRVYGGTLDRAVCIPFA